MSWRSGKISAEDKRPPRDSRAPNGGSAGGRHTPHVKEKRVDIFGTVVLVPETGSGEFPQMLLTVDYATGSVKIAGGKRNKGEHATAAINREFEEETGISAWPFVDGDLIWTHVTPTRDCYTYLKFVRLSARDERWRMIGRPTAQGEGAAPAWVPIQPYSDTFPGNLSSVSSLGPGVLEHINQEVIWKVCEVLAVLFPEVKLPDCPLPSPRLEGFRYTSEKLLQRVQQRAVGHPTGPHPSSKKSKNFVLASVMLVPSTIDTSEKWNGNTGFMHCPHILCSLDNVCALGMPLGEVGPAESPTAAAGRILLENSGYRAEFQESDLRFTYAHEDSSYSCFMKILKVDENSAAWRPALPPPSHNAAISWFAIHSAPSEWLGKIMRKQFSGDGVVFQQVLWQFCGILAAEEPTVKLPTLHTASLIGDGEAVALDCDGVTISLGEMAVPSDVKQPIQETRSADVAAAVGESNSENTVCATCGSSFPNAGKGYRFCWPCTKAYQEKNPAPVAGAVDRSVGGRARPGLGKANMESWRGKKP